MLGAKETFCDTHWAPGNKNGGMRTSTHDRAYPGTISRPEMYKKIPMQSMQSMQVMSAGTMPEKKTSAMLPAEEENFYY